MPEPERWFRLANAYLDSSLHVFRSIVSGGLARDYYHAAVGGFLFEHSLELFLKAAILQAGSTVQGDHDLQRHYQQFQNLYPGKRFAFEGAIQDAAETDAARPKRKFHRYPGPKPNEAWGVSTHFTTEIWIAELERFQKDYARLQPLCKERYRGTSSQGGCTPWSGEVS